MADKTNAPSVGEPKTEYISLSMLRVDGGTQMRVGLNMERLRDYTETVRDDLSEAEEKAGPSGDLMKHYTPSLPPIEVIYDGVNFWVWDGLHRRQAYAENNMAVVPARVRQGTQRDAILLAAGANKHGLPLSSSERRKAVITMLRDAEWGSKDAWPDRAIAKHVGVSHVTVFNLRRKLDEAANGAGNTKDEAFNLNEANGQANNDLPADLAEKVAVAELTEQQARFIVKQRAAKQGGKGTAPEDAESDEEAAPAKSDEVSSEPSEDDLTDDEFLESLPIYRVLRKRQHGGVLLRQDILDWRTLQNMKFWDGMRQTLGRTVAKHRDGGSTHLRSILLDAYRLPHPSQWLVCPRCHGSGSASNVAGCSCGSAGYSCHIGSKPKE